MYNMFYIFLGCIATSILSLIITPFVRRAAFIVGATDAPNARRMNKKVMPSMGGLSIYLSFFIAVFFIQRITSSILVPFFVASTIIILTGIIDDIKEISPKAKLSGILIAAIIIFYWAEIRMDSVTLPLLGNVDMGIVSLPFTVVWILGITNSINLIDGLDGLASGVSMIALTTMGIIGFFFLGSGNISISLMIFTFVAAIFGFYPYNFYPAKIYLGDTGALFLGFAISVFSLYNLKNVTFVSFVIPVVVLGIPITDTFYAIVRRFLNRRPISQPDKEHMHHRLMVLGLTHRQTVLFIYCVALIFSLIALLYPISSIVGSILITVALIIGLELFVELIGLVGKENRPLISQIQKFAKRLNKKSS